MKLDLDSQSIDIPCQGCSAKHSTTIGRLKSEQQFICSGCGATNGVDTTQFKRGEADVQKALDDLTRSLKGLGRH